MAKWLTVLVLVTWLPTAPGFGQVGLMPIPTFKAAEVHAEASFDPGTQRYTYRYTVSNPASNTGEIWDIQLDVTTHVSPSSRSPAFNSSGLTIQKGGVGQEP